MRRITEDELVYFSIVGFVFFPIFVGFNCFPFERYPQFCKGIVELEGKSWDYEHQSEIKENQWARELEFSWSALSMVDDFYTCQKLKKGEIPFWNPYNGFRFPSFGTGHFRPFNTFKIHFYLFLSLWNLGFCHLLFGGFFFFKISSGNEGCLKKIILFFCRGNRQWRCNGLKICGL